MTSLLSFLVVAFTSVSLANAEPRTFSMPEPVVPPGFNRNGLSTPLTVEQAHSWFRFFAGRKDIPFKYPDDGCNARAHKMARTLEANQILSLKLFITASNGAYFTVPTPYHPDGQVNWFYHVAPAVLVRTWAGDRAQYRFWVLDPAIMSQAVPAEDWLQAIGRSSAGGYSLDYFPRFVYRTDRGNPGHWLQEDLDEMEISLREGLELQAQRGYSAQRAAFTIAAENKFSEKVTGLAWSAAGVRVQFGGHAGVFHVDPQSPHWTEILASLMQSHLLGVKAEIRLDAVNRLLIHDAQISAGSHD